MLRSLIDILDRACQPRRHRDLLVALWEQERWFDTPHQRDAAETARDALVEAGPSGVRLATYPCDGKTRYRDWILHVAWDCPSARLAADDAERPYVVHYGPPSHPSFGWAVAALIGATCPAPKQETWARHPAPQYTFGKEKAWGPLANRLGERLARHLQTCSHMALYPPSEGHPTGLRLPMGPFPSVGFFSLRSGGEDAQDAARRSVAPGGSLRP
jgi:hypothetical protein